MGVSYPSSYNVDRVIIMFGDCQWYLSHSILGNDIVYHINECRNISRDLDHWKCRLISYNVFNFFFFLGGAVEGSLKETCVTPRTSYQTRKIANCIRRECREHFPRHRLQRKPLVSDPGMHHGSCIKHVPWCMSGSLTRGGGENVACIRGACATRNFTYLVRGPYSAVVIVVEKERWTRRARSEGVLLITVDFRDSATLFIYYIKRLKVMGIKNVQFSVIFVHRRRCPGPVCN